MNIIKILGAINTGVCIKTECNNFYENRMGYWWCRLLKKCDKMGKSGYNCNHCPIPQDCPNKVLHILRKEALMICETDDGDYNFKTDCPQVVIEIRYP